MLRCSSPYLLGAIIFAPLFGRLIDYLGARTILITSLWGYFIFGVGGMFVQGPVMVAIDRILLGGFAVGAMAAGTAVISQWYAGKERLGMIAKQGMAIELGGVIFLFVGGLLSEMSWQAPFLLYALGFFCVVLTLLSIPKTEPRTNNVNAPVDARKTQSMGPIMLTPYWQCLCFTPSSPHYLGCLRSSCLPKPKPVTYCRSYL
ncbi:MFS transporter [Marinobacter similis]|uniref:MFS transporter n=1 Tax=Marinobacter similis TaxID=1420916 RepID=UPI000B90F35C